jgi:hypothetical protein
MPGATCVLKIGQYITEVAIYETGGAAVKWVKVDAVPIHHHSSSHGFPERLKLNPSL